LRWIKAADAGKGISCSIARKRPADSDKELKMPTRLKDFASAPVTVVEPETPARVAAQLMRKHHVGALVVVDAAQGSRPVGILTDRDLVLALMAEGLDPEVFTAGDIMSAELVRAAPGMDALDAVALMRRHRLRRLVIVDEAGRLTGLVTMEDILALLTREMADLAAGVIGARDREFEQRA
jgi:CBS domain-containing protein